MDFIRASVHRVRGGTTQHDDDPEQQRDSPPMDERRRSLNETEAQNNDENYSHDETRIEGAGDEGRGRFPFRRPAMPWLFTPRPSSSQYGDSYSSEVEGSEIDGSARPAGASATTTPRLGHLTLGSLFSSGQAPSRSHDDVESGTGGHHENNNSNNDGYHDQIASPAAIAAAATLNFGPQDTPVVIDPPQPSERRSGNRSGRSRFRGADPEEGHLAELADTGRRRRDRRRKRKHQHQQSASSGDGSSNGGSGGNEDDGGDDDGNNRRRRRKKKSKRDKRERTNAVGGYFHNYLEHRRRVAAARYEGTRDEETGKPKRFLYCFPWVKSKKLRGYILRCFVSGLFLFCLLTVYLSLSLTKAMALSEFSILLILIILFTTIFFCHGLVRICMLVARKDRGDNDDDTRSDDEMAEMADYHRRHGGPPQFQVPSGYAVPRHPIPVLLARDEDAAGLPSETVSMKPPAYGQWRQSVRVDPNLIYWERAAAEGSGSPSAGGASPAVSSAASGPSTSSRSLLPSSPESPSEGNGGHSSSTSPALSGQDDNDNDRDGASLRRPPSYASEDGVDYVVEARPRSIAPTAMTSFTPSLGGRGPTTHSYYGGGSVAGSAAPSRSSINHNNGGRDEANIGPSGAADAAVAMLRGEGGSDSGVAY